MLQAPFWIVFYSPPPIELVDGPKYKVKTILDLKVVNNKLYYLVEWLSLSPSD